MASCLRRTRTALAVIKAVISRSLFALHGFICIWRVTVVKGKPLYWCLSCTLPLMVLEAVFTIKAKKGGEWKWLCPSVLLYIGTAVPAIWFLELDLMEARMTSLSAHDALVTQRNSSDDDAISGVLRGKLRIRISLNREEWCKILEQMLLLILIIGRWLLPKGEISREQLSQLLLVYIGMAADIIELFEAFKEDGVRENSLLTLIILSLWTASLMQFTFVLTATKSKRMRPVLFNSGSSASAISVGGKSCCPTEVVSIVISMVLQDGPFLVLRLLLIFRYDVLSYTNLFFTSKNSLVLVLQLYRLVVLFSHTKDTPDGDETTSDRSSRADSGQHPGPGAAGSKGGHSTAAAAGAGPGPRSAASGREAWNRAHGKGGGGGGGRHHAQAPPPASPATHRPTRHRHPGRGVTSSDDVARDAEEPGGGGKRRQQGGGGGSGAVTSASSPGVSAKRRESFRRQRRPNAVDSPTAPGVSAQSAPERRHQGAAGAPLLPPVPTTPSASSLSRSPSGSSSSLTGRSSAAAAYLAPPFPTKPLPSDHHGHHHHHDQTERLRGSQFPGTANDGMTWPYPQDSPGGKARRGGETRRELDRDGGRGHRGADRETEKDGEGGGRGGGRKEKGPRGSGSPSPQWQGSHGQPQAVAVVNESGRYRALVLRPVETADRQTVYVVESEHESGIQCV